MIFCVSGGWFSAHEAINTAFADEFLKRGYTVFAVVHGSQPQVHHSRGAWKTCTARSATSAIMPPTTASTRSASASAARSAGGHLSLMQGTAGTAGDAAAKDPVDRESSRVQAVACFFPPTDFLNYGEPGENAMGRGVLKNFQRAVRFPGVRQRDATLRADHGRSRRSIEIGKQISPVNHVTADDPPTLIIHGDADKLVPIQQAEFIVDKLKAAGVPAELVVKTGSRARLAEYDGRHGVAGRLVRQISGGADAARSDSRKRSGQPASRDD